MGRTQLTLKPFIDKYIQKNYVNFKRLENGNFQLLTPRKTKNLDEKCEQIFKDYEINSGRKYSGYEKCKNKFKQAVKRSYKVVESGKEKFIFREKTTEEKKKEIEMRKLKKEQASNKIKVTPLSPGSETGYETGESSCSVSNPDPVESCSIPNLEDVPSEYIDFDYDMEELTAEGVVDDQLQSICNEVYEKFHLPSAENMQFSEVGNEIIYSGQEGLDGASGTVQGTTDFSGILTGGCAISYPGQEVLNELSRTLQGATDFSELLRVGNEMIYSGQKVLDGDSGTVQDTTDFSGIPTGGCAISYPSQEVLNESSRTLQGTTDVSELLRVGNEIIYSGQEALDRASGTVRGTTDFSRILTGASEDPPEYYTISLPRNQTYVIIGLSNLTKH